MVEEYKLQRGDNSKPVIWGVQISQELTEKIEKYAKKKGICEGDVFREALQAKFKGI